MATRYLAHPSAQTISVALGRSEQMRMGSARADARRGFASRPPGVATENHRRIEEVTKEGVAKEGNGGAIAGNEPIPAARVEIAIRPNTEVADQKEDKRPRRGGGKDPLRRPSAPHGPAQQADANKTQPAEGAYPGVIASMQHLDRDHIAEDQSAKRKQNGAPRASQQGPAEQEHRAHRRDVPGMRQQAQQNGGRHN